MPIYIYLYLLLIKSEVWIISHCLGISHETMVCVQNYRLPIAIALGMWLCSTTSSFDIWWWLFDYSYLERDVTKTSALLLLAMKLLHDVTNMVIVTKIHGDAKRRPAAWNIEIILDGYPDIKTHWTDGEGRQPRIRWGYYAITSHQSLHLSDKNE